MINSNILYSLDITCVNFFIFCYDIFLIANNKNNVEGVDDHGRYQSSVG